MPFALGGASLAHLGAGRAQPLRAVLHLCNAAFALVATLCAEGRAFAHVGHVSTGVGARLAVRRARLAGFDDLVVVVHGYSAMIA